jgi:hypothetical protein
MKRKIIFLSILVLLANMQVIVGCSSKSDNPAPSPAPAPVTTLSAVAISPATVSLGFSTQQIFTGSGGTPPYSYFKVSGNGQMSLAGVFFSPTSNESDVVGVRDYFGATAFATITVSDTIGASVSSADGLSISPTTWTLNQGASVTLTASSGVPAYTFTHTSGTGTIQVVSADTIIFTAPNADEIDTIQLTDSNGVVVNASVTVSNAIIPSGSLNEIYRFYNSANTDHLFTTNPTEVNSAPWTSEGAKFKLFQSQATGTQPIYRCRTNNTQQYHFLSKDSNCDGQITDSDNRQLNVVGYISPISINGMIPLYRFNTSNSNFFTTIDFNEGLINGWSKYTILGYVFGP